MGSSLRPPSEHQLLREIVLQLGDDVVDVLLARPTDLPPAQVMVHNQLPGSRVTSVLSG